MADLRYPSLYQINTRVWLTELSRRDLESRGLYLDMPGCALPCFCDVEIFLNVKDMIDRI
jgi:hypothetical protein